MRHMLDSPGMARKQVLVQLDDELVVRLDTLAEAEGVSRSDLLRRAATALLDARDEIDADRRLVEAYRRQPHDPELTDAFMRASLEGLPPW